VRLHAPTRGWFTASLIIALIAVIGALSPVPYLTSYGTWVAILAYRNIENQSLKPRGRTIWLLMFRQISDA
jgi:hypothetical protein